MSSSARSALNPTSRAAHLEQLAATSPSNPLDILIVGGGVNGAGAAFDAATRGLSVGIVEMNDWASGTSSRSSKLMHGGLRYLQMLDFTLVAEALRERDLLISKTAPHLVKPISFMFPMKNVFERGFIGSGIALYDAMQIGHREVPIHKHVFSKGLAKDFAGLDPEKNSGAIEFYDSRMDDARFVAMLVRSAVNLGAAAANYTKVARYLKDGGRVVGAAITDLETGNEYEVHAREVILAGGVWTGEEQDRAGADSGLQVLASKGIHITVPREAIEAKDNTGIITQTEKSVLFIIPWDEYWLIGTTDTPWKDDVSVPTATSSDIDYVLEKANDVLRRPLTREDVIGVYAGLRPLLQPVKKSDGASTKVSREHTVMEVEPGLSAIAGGKYTTYRVMAEDVVDFALRRTPEAPTTKTRDIPVIGGAGYEEMRVRATALAGKYGIDEVRLERLLFRYGSLLEDIFALMDENPELATPLKDAPRYLRAEIVYAARSEGVLHLADALMRRTRLDYETRDRGVSAAREVAGILAEELGWDEAQREAEIEAYSTFIAARLEAEHTTSDADAAALLENVREIPAR